MKKIDIVIVGAGPVGMMCAYLGKLCGLDVMTIDKSVAPLEVGRADALNARTLQLFEMVGLFDELYPKGKKCNTSSIWQNGKFISRESSWWDELEGCFHKHFLMIGQSFVEKLLDTKLKELNAEVVRSTTIDNIEIVKNRCFSNLSSGEIVESKFVIGADGAHSFVRQHFDIPFEIERPEITWAVIDGVINTDFPKVPEIIVFQTESSDVAWIPREGNIDRFYVRMDTKDFNLKDVLKKINNAMKPHWLKFEKIVWFSQFSVKESVAENFSVENKVFLAGDSCHIHSVNGGQGLNTGLADAFNLIWKLNLSLKNRTLSKVLDSYEIERKKVAQSVIKSSGELVRSTKYSDSGTHAKDYLEIVKRRSGNITGMGIRYSDVGLKGSRLLDFETFGGSKKTRIYSILDYSQYSLLIFGELETKLKLPTFIKMIHIHPNNVNNCPYSNQAILVRPDSYIAKSLTLAEIYNSDLFSLKSICELF